MKPDQNKFRKLTGFETRVFQAVKKIPQGKVTTYQFLAQVIGRPQAVQAVGNALSKNTRLIKIPCHRVIKSNGRLGGYRLGQKRKLSLLRKEGITIKGDKIRNFKKFLYKF